MEIQVEKVIIDKLPKLPEGYFYTQAEEVEIQNRTLSEGPVWLACTATPDDWKIISKEEADEIIRLQEEHNKEQLNNEDDGNNI